jgi:hypothetical protein
VLHRQSRSESLTRKSGEGGLQSPHSRTCHWRGQHMIESHGGLTIAGTVGGGMPGSRGGGPAQPSGHSDVGESNAHTHTHTGHTLSHAQRGGLTSGEDILARVQL